MSNSVKLKSSSIELKDYSYGKSSVRLVKVERCGYRHNVKDINVDIQLFGAFEDAYREGDNRLLLPTDSMKNTVYAFARREPIGEIEEFGLHLADHFLSCHSHLSRAHITISENIWRRIECNGAPRAHAFQLSNQEGHATIIDRNRIKTSIKAIITDLVVLKTTRSAFENFLRDEYTTLKEAHDRLLWTTVRAEWSYRNKLQSFGELWKGVRTTLLDVFAIHDSRSVQHTLCAMGEAVLQQFDSIDEIRLSMPNQHCLLVDLSPFNLDNPNEVFMPIDEPSGLIEATLARSSSCECP
jgi:urate oxidase